MEDEEKLLLTWGDLAGLNGGKISFGRGWIKGIPTGKNNLNKGTEAGKYKAHFGEQHIC